MMGSCLSSIKQNEGSVIVCYIDNLFDRKRVSINIRRIDKRNQLDLWTQDVTKGVHAEGVPVVGSNHNMLQILAFGHHLARHQTGVVLSICGQYLVARSQG